MRPASLETSFSNDHTEYPIAKMSDVQTQSSVRINRRRPWRLLGSALVVGSLCSASALALPKKTASLKNLAEPFSISEITAPRSLASSSGGGGSGGGGGADYKSPSEFDLFIGKAKDTLDKDYPHLLSQNPDYSIYHPDLRVVDPSGVQVRGIRAYQRAFSLLHALVGVVYCEAKSDLTFRSCYDAARQSIRIHWHAQLVPREIFGGQRTTLYADGISVYQMDAESLSITAHKIESLLMNNMSIKPEEGLIAALRQEHGVTVPSFIRNQASNNNNSQQKPTSMVRFQQQPLSTWLPFQGGNRPVKSLFASEQTADDYNNENDGNLSDDLVDRAALEAKNKSRKKFGLKPLSVEEFLALNVQIAELDAQQQEKKLQQQAAAAKAAAQAEKKENSVWSKLASALDPDTCESNFDCERPLVCCDFGFVQKCCSNGNLVIDRPRQAYQPATVPVPVQLPPQGPQERGLGY